LLAADISVRKEVRAINTFVYANPGELRQIIANLIGNSLDAMRMGGKLRLKISLQRNWKGEGGQQLSLTIADTGSGIDPSLLPTIFQPFVTTKGETGTGLGLWVIQELADKNCWTIRVRSSIHPHHRGTVFSILMPV
jgi:signal transduction histidine kinase